MDQLLNFENFQDTLKKSIKEIPNFPNKNFYLYVNQHGYFVQMTLVAYSPETINCFVVNVTNGKPVESHKEVIIETVDFLKNMNVKVNGVFQDGETSRSIDQIPMNASVTLHSLSNMLFKCFQNTSVMQFDRSSIHDPSIRDLPVIVHSRPWAITEAVLDVPGLNEILSKNVNIFDIKHRRAGQEFDVDVFSNHTIQSLMNRLKDYSENEAEFNRYERLFEVVLKFFQILWVRKDLVYEADLIANGDRLIAISNQLPDFSSFYAINDNSWRFYTLIKSIESLTQILTADKIVPFIALTLLIEYELTSKRSLSVMIKKLTEKDFVIHGAHSWMGKTTARIIFHKIDKSASKFIDRHTNES